MRDSQRLSSLPSRLSSNVWTRRAWIQTTVPVGAVAFATTLPRPRSGELQKSVSTATSTIQSADWWSPEQLELWAIRAIDAARAGGATYADARCTRIVQHTHEAGGDLSQEVEVVGVGVRALVNGYWGFAACPLWTSAPDGSDAVIQLAHDAVAQARVNARGTPRTVEMGTIPAAVGTWTTPIRIDPFSISLEEKKDYFGYLANLPSRFGLALHVFRICFVRRESVVATSDGSHFRQTCYESGGDVRVRTYDGQTVGHTSLPLRGLEEAGKGWEIFQDANLLEQMAGMRDTLRTLEELNRQARSRAIGRYTLVCDGATMASLLENTLGLATQLDRALGYEADAAGTTYIDDPLAMVGQLQVASPLITVTGNRSAPGQLATVKWDDEGVEPHPFSVVKDGVLVDFQTTREQAAWLAPYYQRRGKAVQSHGCAASENATKIPMQHMPNLALLPSPSPIHQEDLVADVKDGLLIENGTVAQSDFQGCTGLLDGRLREIKNGRLGKVIAGGSIFFNAKDLWKNITAIGGISTEDGIASTGEAAARYLYMFILKGEDGMAAYAQPALFKGQPSQYTNHSVRGVAATIMNQPLIDPQRRV